MSNETIKLAASKRDLLGKQVRSLRAAGQTPAVVHDHGKDSIHIVVEEREFKKVYHNAGRHHPVVLNVDGKTYTTLIKEVTRKPASATVYHSVFQAIKANETVKAEVPIHLTGEIPAERAGLLVLHNLNVVEIEALPKDLIDSFEVDASGLEQAGDTLTVADLKVPEGVEIKTDPEQNIATVEIPRDQVAEADAAQAELTEAAGADAIESATEGDETDSEEGTDGQPADEKQE